MVTSGDVLRSALMKSGMTQTDIAKLLDCTAQNISLRLKRGSLRFEELTAMLGLCGYEVHIVGKDGKELPIFGNGKGTRMVKRVSGKEYDTAKSCAIASTQRYEGKDCFAELYETVDEDYFVAAYGSPMFMLTPVDRETAEQYKREWENAENQQKNFGDYAKD